MAFVTLVLVEFFQAFNCRSEKYSLFKIGVFKNGWLLAAVASQLILLNILVYVPALHDPFNTHSLSVMDWVVAVSSASTMFLVVEAAKWLAALKGSRKVKPGAAARVA